MENTNTILGWVEWLSLPDLSLPAIKAKVDTGAATSSLHAYKIKYLAKDGKKYVKFEVHPIQRNNKIKKMCIAPLVGMRLVRSSSGEQKERPVILTSIKIGSTAWPIELNLTNRDPMGMRMLLGRQAILGKCLVNPTHKFLHWKLSMKKSKELYKGLEK
jgi:ribosomal protein S6--L-glutamate ligase